ncbi:hypothetical protein SNK03_012113 [Fusarium graminearum]
MGLVSKCCASLAWFILPITAKNSPSLAGWLARSLADHYRPVRSPLLAVLATESGCYSTLSLARLLPSGPVHPVARSFPAGFPRSTYLPLHSFSPDPVIPIYILPFERSALPCTDDRAHQSVLFFIAHFPVPFDLVHSQHLAG